MVIPRTHFAGNLHNPLEKKYYMLDETGVEIGEYAGLCLISILEGVKRGSLASV